MSFFPLQNAKGNILTVKRLFSYNHNEQAEAFKAEKGHKSSMKVSSKWSMQLFCNMSSEAMIAE